MGKRGTRCVKVFSASSYKCSARGTAKIEGNLTLISCSGRLSASDINAELNFGTFGRQIWRWYSATSIALENICLNRRMAAFRLGRGSSFLMRSRYKMMYTLQE